MTSSSVLGILAVAFLGACGGHSGGAVPGAVPPASSASGAVKEFMAGVADSNIVRIGSAWGTEKGSAARRNEPSDWQKRYRAFSDRQKELLDMANEPAAPPA